MNIDKDKKVIKDNIYTDIGKKAHYIDISGEDCYEFIEAILNILSELETYKKIAKRLAKEILLQYPEMFNMVTVNNMEILIENARKEVEKDDN